MSEYLIQEETLQGIADKIRALSGTEGTMSPAEMQSNLETFNSELTSALEEQNAIIERITANATKTYVYYHDTNVEDAYVMRALTKAVCSVTTSIGDRAFYMCTSLTSVNFPKVTSIGNSAFGGCSSLTSVSLPVCTSIGSYAFSGCTSLTSVSLPVCTFIGGEAFSGCYNLKSLTIGTSTVCTLVNSNAFNSTPIGGYSASAGTYGSIYVPASLLANYQTASNWSYFSSRFVGY